MRDRDLIASSPRPLRGANAGVSRTARSGAHWIGDAGIGVFAVASEHRRRSCGSIAQSKGRVIVTSSSLRAALQQFLREDRLAWHFGHLPVRRPNSWWCRLALKFCADVDLLAALSCPLGRLSGLEVFGENRRENEADYTSPLAIVTLA